MLILLKNFLFGIKLFLDSFNKQEEDFETLDDFNDYLEMVESISKYCSCHSRKPVVHCSNLIHFKAKRS